MRFSYSVSNLRRLSSTPHVEIRPITVLLGKNSVGKSTFLRSFPLLRQSVETKSSAPILWYGDYVDFGEFRTAVTDYDIDRNIEFSFELQDYSGTFNNRNALSSRYGGYTRPQFRFDVDRLQVGYQVGSRSDATELRHISVRVPTRSMELLLSFDKLTPLATSIELNGLPLSELTSSFEIYFSPDTLFSEPYFLEKRKDKTRLYGKYRTEVFTSLIEKELSTKVDARISSHRISAEARRILRHDSLDHENLSSLERTDTLTFQRIYRRLKSGGDSPSFTKLNALCQAHYLFNLLEAVGDDLQGFFRTVEYINPARARSERFYRQQELEVSEISPDGKNLPMFLASLDWQQLDDFSDWVKRVFGYGVSVKRSEGHISIFLEHRGQSVNIVDTGYGVSQVLPVLAQIWWMQVEQRDRRFGRSSSRLDFKTLAIEQPELHLHPAHQALLADVFVEALSGSEEKNGTSLYYIVETHSESLINRLGELIGMGRVHPSDVQIVIFDDQSDELCSNEIILAEFDEEGVLTNWPFGFFDFA